MHSAVRAAQTIPTRNKQDIDGAEYRATSSYQNAALVVSPAQPAANTGSIIGAPVGFLPIASGRVVADVDVTGVCSAANELVVFTLTIGAQSYTFTVAPGADATFQLSASFAFVTTALPIGAVVAVDCTWACSGVTTFETSGEGGITLQELPN